jgi:hypothetical protein
VTTWDHNSREMSTFGRCLETSSSAGAGLDGLELAAGLLFRVEEVVSNCFQQMIGIRMTLLTNG